ncbi:MAG: hypothetical protein ABIJ43_00930 [Candidatus Beckwithbacteria bacterium]|nr:hypothetical protein [Patescibacteria group bacterium]
MKKKLPKKLYSYFWEVDSGEIRLEKDRDYIVKRLIDYGKTSDIKWLMKTYGPNSIKYILTKYRGIFRRTAMLWANVLDINPAEIKCLQTPYHRIPFGV